MKHRWHERIQRYLEGQAGAEESAAFQAAMKNDSDLRALYLDYVNLDVALVAVAEVAAIPENVIGGTATLPRSPAQSSRHYWRWIAAIAAASAALVVMRMLPRHRNASPARPDVVAACSSTQGAIARLSVEPPSVFPAWASPTASMLDQPPIPQWDP